MYKQNKIQAFIIFLFFALMMVSAIQFRDVAKIMPVFVSGLGMLCSAAMFIWVCMMEVKKRPIREVKAYPQKDTIEIIHAFAMVSIYCLVMKPVGFLISSIVFFFLFELRFGEKKKWLKYLVVSVATTLVIYIIFSVTLHTNFPPGILKGIL